MKVIVVGAAGVIGRGVLRACLADDRVGAVLAVGRVPTGERHPKLRELVRPDLSDLAPVRDALAGHDACFCCPEGSPADVALAAGAALAEVAPGSAFLYVSGAEDGDPTEEALLALPLRAYIFRPGYVPGYVPRGVPGYGQPMHGTVARTRLHRPAYVAAAPFRLLLRLLRPAAAVTTAERLGRAMIAVAERGAPRRILTAADIDAW
ncbi:epimerase [Nonomuraea sp. NPDC023979]|uniref:epimerase n=1 Tax=Nonomuraea sp. NPDC023979 TaxID=3154796 RepID=UPI0033CF3866